MVDAHAASNFIADWQTRAEQVRANQPDWSSPLITTTGMLEQRFRFDASEQHAGNGAATTVLDGGRGVISRFFDITLFPVRRRLCLNTPRPNTDHRIHRGQNR
jgi:hypothetical protein